MSVFPNVAGQSLFGAGRLGSAVVDGDGCRKFMYVPYTSLPFGEMATAGKSGRSTAGEAIPPEVQVPPPLSDDRTFTCSFAPGLLSDGVGPFAHASTISFVAP